MWKPSGGKLRALTFAPDGQTVATIGGESRFVILRDPLTGDPKKSFGATYTPPVAAVVFAPDGKYLAWVDRSGGVCVWAADPPGTAPAAVLSTTHSTSKMLAFDPTGDRLVTAGNLSVEWWNHPAETAAPRKPTGTERRQSRGAARAIAYTPDGELFLVGGRELEIWKPDLATPVGFVPLQRGEVRTMVASPDSSRVACVVKNTVRVCRLADRKWEATLHTGREMIYAAAFTPDGRSILTAGADGSVRFWDTTTWREARRFDWGIGKIHLAAFAPDGLTCAAAGEKGGVVVWDVDG
jgi:WD40 repeat protein